MRLVTDVERRARLARRHALAPGHEAESAEGVTKALTVLHSTEPATPYLSCWARTNATSPEDLDRALYQERSLVKQLAMRRTLFVFPRDLLPAAWPSASARVAASERSKLMKDVVSAGVSEDGSGWLDAARAEILAVLAEHAEGLTAAEIRTAVPRLEVKLDGLGAGPRILTWLGAGADIVRGANTGRWATSRPRWTLVGNWLTAVPRQVDPAAGYRELVRRWLYSFGPGTEADLVWWLGSTKAAVRRALAELRAEAVRLEDDSTAWLLPDDLDEVGDPGPWVRLLPVLDPTVMGWQGRGFYLGPHKDRLFDTRGNVGTSAWANGRMVGCWVQDEAGQVEVRLVETVPVGVRQALDAEAARLSAWLGGLRIGTVYRSPAMK
ncbi:winged helix DNA-binding domain-containing protein [Kineosporia babensis]|uniref:winged helix DNA-binding domain-containing protein n=1 Tax=Kineosporia babensis TaxID=499548 RepID=UPI0038B25090